MSDVTYFRKRDDSIAETLGTSRFQVGDRCIFYRDDSIYFGTVRYIGPLTDVHLDGSDDMRRDNVIGIETDHAGDGLCNGLIGEKQYFTCAENKGIFVSASRVYPLDFENPIYEGVLTKKGFNRKNWKKRYFIVKQLFMYYFMITPSGHRYGDPLGVVPLFGMEILPYQKKPNAFTLRNKLSRAARQWYFQAAVEGGTDTWMDKIREATRVKIPTKVPII